MFTTIKDVIVERPYCRLMETGPNGRPLIGPPLFEEGTDKVDLFTFAASNGAFFRGVFIKGDLYFTTVTVESKVYYANHVKVAGAAAVIDDGVVFNHKLQPVTTLNKILEEATEELKAGGYQRMVVKMPRYIDNCNRNKWLGLLAKPIWRRN